ncbi:MAG: RNA 2',3'-cyclic phosphodiesterase [Spirochaetales bacterium]|nr:RNA 2',3'-cyclic phosphodiesterase [Spirochaetales bacterium]
MSDRHHDHRPRNYGRENTFRAFIALDIEDNARHELSRLASLLKEQCNGSYPSSDMYHMTVAFLGDITIPQAEALTRVLEEVADKYDSFVLKLCRLGYFAQPESATVFCSTERDNTLISLAQDVYRAAWDVRIPFDDKPFRAHITLGRRVDLSTIRLNSIEVNHVPFTVKGLTLYKSTLRPSGPIYEAINTISF